MAELGLLTPMLLRCFLLRFLLALPEDEWAEAECELIAIGKGDGAVVAAAAAARAAALGPFNASTRLKVKKIVPILIHFDCYNFAFLLFCHY